MENTTFTLTTDRVSTYGYTEVLIDTAPCIGMNPYTHTRTHAEVACPDGGSIRVEGFCSSDDGSRHVVRIMARQSGTYGVKAVYRRSDGVSAEWTGTFHAERSSAKGLLKRDAEHPWHFVWEGTGEHFLWNGTTTYYLMGWEDEAEIRGIIDRLSGLRINRLRVMLYGRQDDMPWGMPVRNTDAFNMTLNPWKALWPRDVANPEFDYARFNLPYWERFERMLAYAASKDVTVSVIFHIGAQVLPVPYEPTSEDEYRFYRYAVARLAAFPNVTWDIGNEHDFHRNRFWVAEMVRFMKSVDPYGHLTGVHNAVYHNMGLDMQLMQIWDAGLNGTLLAKRREQEASGEVVPQIIEEYGYEDLWEKYPGQRSADTRRRVAWEVYMAGCYQTNGETAKTGAGVAPDTGGGWVTGRGDDSMTMLKGFFPIIDFLSSFDWWRANPANHLVMEYVPTSDPTPEYKAYIGDTGLEPRAFCLAEPGRAYAVYLTCGGSATLETGDGTYSVTRMNPRTGETETLPDAAGSVWRSPATPDQQDWAYLLKAKA